MGLNEEELAARHKELCGLVVEGKTIRQIAAQYGVSAGSIIAWLTDTPERAEHYTRARDAAADLFESEIIEAAMAVSPESAPADRVKIDALKWVAARRAPKRYSERLQQQIDHTSSDKSFSAFASQEAVLLALARKHTE